MIEPFLIGFCIGCVAFAAAYFVSGRHKRSGV